MTPNYGNLLAGVIAISFLTTPASVWSQSPAAEVDFGSANAVSVAKLGAAFVKADINKDGKLSRLEAESVPGLVARFDSVDTDGDKFVSRAEFDKAIQ